MDYVEITYKQLGDWVKPDTKIIVNKEWFLLFMKDYDQPPNINYNLENDQEKIEDKDNHE
jgi:hypothetical protein